MNTRCLPSLSWLVIATVAAAASVSSVPARAANAASSPASPASPTSRPSTQPVTEGLRVFICGHSFHVFVSRQLPEVVRAAGIPGHSIAGVQSIGGSTAMQHWNLADDKNKVKPALTEGRVDVLTLAPAWVMPDEGIDRLVELAVAHNPNVRVVVQQSWMGYDGLKEPYRIRNNADRDQKTVEQLRAPLDAYHKVLTDQLRAINEKHGRSVAFIAPTGDAVLRLRERVIAGKVPGVATQSALFRDPIGHGTEAIERLNTYTQFAVIYRRSPVGLKVFEKPGNEEWNRLNLLLQEIAWEAACAEPLSGLGEGRADAAKR